VTTETKAVANYDSLILSNAGAVGAEMKALIATIPEADEDAYVGILASILSAETVEDIDAPWTARSLEAFIDAPLRVTGIRRMPSDFDQGLGTYLVVEANIPGDGERIVLTTGSVSVVMQLCKAYALGALPLLVIVRKAKRASANGYFPMHLEIVRAR